MENDSIFNVRYYAEKINLKSSSNEISRIGQTLFNSKIKLNPHQIESALFYFNNPFQKGIILADEVGLGKTIEAGIIIAQTWCERKRKIVIICPASLIKQWQEELLEKFNLNSEILDRKTFNSYKKKGYENPFDINNKIFICSINFASKEYLNLKCSTLDLIVIDEAHNLRNVYKKNNSIAKNLLEGVSEKKKLLLTATPFQNSLMELYGLTRFVDNELFGDSHYFRHKYISNYSENSEELRSRLATICKRTLRIQAEKYIKYSKRITNTFEFNQTNQEQLLYDKITDLILDEQFESIFGKGRTQLVILIFRKLLSSSTYAIIGTLESIKKSIEEKESLNLLENEELYEIEEDEEIEFENINNEETIIISDEKKYKYLIEKIDNCLELAKNIKIDTKSIKLIEAVNYSFNIIEKEKNRNKKILIFTESRRTQNYLYDILKKAGYEKIIKFNGSNDDDESKIIYEKWKENQNSTTVNSNSKASNIRQAKLEYFKNECEIMIATEAAAEGLNMQFCSVMINYDLPWNPQRLEQRIGRCHRYGQINDVIIINMLNTSNAIDKRIYQLLNEKLFLFNDVFGASDEVLGNLENSNELQKNIIDIYKKCRTPEEINKAFDEVQQLYKEDINKKMLETRKQLLDNFDEDIQKKFDDTLIITEKYIKEFENDYWRILKYTLKDYAVFHKDSYSFEVVQKNQYIDIGNYTILKDDNFKKITTSNDVYGKKILNLFYEKPQIMGKVIFDLTNYKYKISELEKYKGLSGKMILTKLKIQSYEDEDYLVLDAIMENGNVLDQETCNKFLRLYCNSYTIENIASDNKLKENHIVHIESILKEYSDKSNDLFYKESKEINAWAEDMTASIQLKANMLRDKRKEKQKLLDYAITQKEQKELEDEIDQLTLKIKKMWLELSDNEDVIEEKRRNMIKRLKKDQQKTIEKKPIFIVEFKVI